MALQVKAIKQKMKSIGNIKKITKTMEMISVSKMRKAVGQAQASKSYAKAVLELVSYLAKQEGITQENEFFRTKAQGRKLAIVIASNKGLCGAYNTNIYKKLAAYKATAGADIDCITIGKHAEKAARRLGLPMIASFVKLSEKSIQDEAPILSNITLEHFTRKGYQEVFIIYTAFAKALTFAATAKKLLPLDISIIEGMSKTINPKENVAPKKERELLSEYLFEPTKAFLLQTALPKLVHFIIYQACLESLASEHSARMLAMKNASDNASDIFKNLQLSFNHARQDGITKELSEIIGGASTLEQM